MQHLWSARVFSLMCLETAVCPREVLCVAVLCSAGAVPQDRSRVARHGECSCKQAGGAGQCAADASNSQLERTQQLSLGINLQLLINTWALWGDCSGRRGGGGSGSGGDSSIGGGNSSGGGDDSSSYKSLTHVYLAVCVCVCWWQLFARSGAALYA